MSELDLTEATTKCRVYFGQVNETAPETALRATQTGEHPRRLGRIRGVSEQAATAALEHNFARAAGLLRSCVDALFDELADLRAAGWVDPEEATVWRHIKDRAIEQRDEAQRSADYYREAAVERGKLLERAEAERDALLPVVEAARAWRAMRQDSPTKPKPESAVLIAAVDALDSGTREESTDE